MNLLLLYSNGLSTDLCTPMVFPSCRAVWPGKTLSSASIRFSSSSSVIDFSFLSLHYISNWLRVLNWKVVQIIWFLNAWFKGFANIFCTYIVGTNLAASCKPCTTSAYSADPKSQSKGSQCHQTRVRTMKSGYVNNVETKSFCTSVLVNVRCAVTQVRIKTKVTQWRKLRKTGNRPCQYSVV